MTNRYVICPTCGGENTLRVTYAEVEMSSVLQADGSFEYEDCSSSNENTYCIECHAEFTLDYLLEKGVVGK